MELPYQKNYYISQNDKDWILDALCHLPSRNKTEHALAKVDLNDKTKYDF